MIICVDIDGTLNDLVPKTLAIYNSRTGKNIHMSDITTYSFYECLPKEDADSIFELFKEKELWDSLEPLPNAQWGIETLINAGHEIIIATATYEECFEWKCQWVQKHFPMIDNKNIIRIHNKGLLRSDVLIEDCLENLTKSYCERICLNYPYNHNKIKDDIYEIYRAHDWKEIINCIKDIERKMDKWQTK